MTLSTRCNRASPQLPSRSRRCRPRACPLSPQNWAAPLSTEIDVQMHAVFAVLDQSECARAIQAHAEQATVIAVRDLERVGQRWNLRSARLKTIIANDEPSP